MSAASIAREEEQINKVLGESKARLSTVDQKLSQLVAEHESISEDIQILQERLAYTDNSIAKK